MSAEDETTRATTPRLYVGNIPWSATEQELRDLFADTPGVRRVEIPTGRQGRSRGYGLVEFDTAEEAAAAVSRVDGAYLLRLVARFFTFFSPRVVVERRLQSHSMID